MSCALCERVEKTKTNEYSYLIHEFENSYLYLGEHQYYKGYCILVTKNHFREMTDIPEPMRSKVFSEMMIAHEVIQKVFQPKKMNLCSLGNVVDHVHWHFFPRYSEDENFKNPPWLQMQFFDSARVTPEEREKIVDLIRKQLASM